LADFNRSLKLSINHQNPYVFLAIVTTRCLFFFLSAERWQLYTLWAFLAYGLICANDQCVWN